MDRRSARENDGQLPRIAPVHVVADAPEQGERPHDRDEDRDAADPGDLTTMQLPLVDRIEQVELSRCAPHQRRKRKRAQYGNEKPDDVKDDDLWRDFEQLKAGKRAGRRWSF